MKERDKDILAGEARRIEESVVLKRERKAPVQKKGGLGRTSERLHIKKGLMTKKKKSKRQERKE